MKPTSIYAIIPILEVILTPSIQALKRTARFKTYEGQEACDALAKAILVNNSTTNDTVVIILYPSIMEDDSATVMDTLLHEAVHAWDYTKEHFGYGEDTELNAYAISNIYSNCWAAYKKRKEKGEKQC